MKPPGVVYFIESDSGRARRDQLNTLRERINIISKTQPEILELRKRLLGIGGEELVVIPPDFGGLDPFAPILAELGEVMAYPVRVRKMEPNRCHKNVERLMKDKKLVTAMGRGYGLSDDGLWRSHSWGLKQAGKKSVIIETTVSREIYFGLTLPPGSACCLRYSLSY